MIFIFILAAILLVLDQISKVLIVNYFNGVPVSSLSGIPIIEDVLYFSYQQNEGASFGILQGARWVFIPVTIIACGLFIWWLVRLPKRNIWLKISAGLMLSGAVGNLIDRAFLGYVRDFIATEFMDFPVFNIADCFVCIGAFLYIVYVFTEERRASAQKSQKE